MGQIFLNEEAYGGGSGGNTISYGYTAPSASGNDGDLYYLLNSNDKKTALFMYMTNEWKVIEGNIEAYEVALFKSYLNSTQSDTYTADAPCTVLCLNQTLNGQASTYSNMTASITTSGTVVDTDEYSSSYAGGERNQITRVSLINLEEGDTVTFNNSNGNFTTQLHMVLKLGIFTYADQVTRKVMHATPDNSYSTSQSYTTDEDEIYFAIGFQCRGTGGGTQSATIVASGEADTRELLRAGSNHSVSVSIGYHPNTFTFSWGNQNDYATKGYAVYKIYGGAA